MGKTTRKELFLAEMEQIASWASLLELIAPVYLRAGDRRRPYPLTTMLRVYLMQEWFWLSDPAGKELQRRVALQGRAISALGNL